MPPEVTVPFLQSVTMPCSDQTRWPGGRPCVAAGAGGPGVTPAMGLRPDGAAGAGRSGKAPASYSDRSLAERSAASRGAAELVRIQYREGGVDFLVLPNAERTPLVADEPSASPGSASIPTSQPPTKRGAVAGSRHPHRGRMATMTVTLRSPPRAPNVRASIRRKRCSVVATELGD